MRLILLAILLSITCLAQPIPAHVDRILLTTRLSDADVYQKLADVLSQQGWKRDYDNFGGKESVTLYKPTTAQWSLRLITYVSQGTVTLRGESNTHTSSIHQPVSYAGEDGTINKIHFAHINQLALLLQKAIPGSSVGYR